MSADQRTAGYSGTPLHRKLGVAAGRRVLVQGAPPEWDADPIAAGSPAALHRRPGAAGYDVQLVFCPDGRTLDRRLPAAMTRTAAGGRLWIAWPKRASGVPTDLTEDVVRDAALAVGWVDVKVAAIDAVWSGLCLMRRRTSVPR